MKAQDLMMSWTNGVNNLGSVLKEHRDDVLNSLLDFNFIKNGGPSNIDLNSVIIPDRTIYSRHIEGFEEVCKSFVDVLNDTIFGSYSNKYSKVSDKVYNCICYSLLLRDIERMSESERKNRIIKEKLRHGFIDVLERMYNICKNEKLSTLYTRVYSNSKNNMDNYFYLISPENLSVENDGFAIFLSLKEMVRSCIMRDLILNTHEFDRGDINFYSDAISISAYFAEVLSINYLTDVVGVKVSDSKLLSDFYFNDLTEKYSFEVVG